MTIRTVVPSSYEAYLAFEYPSTSDAAADARAADIQERQSRLEAFPYSVVLQVSYPELDYANRWCWQLFGPAQGICHQASSQYPACQLRNAHSHVGKWMSHWLAKTDYNYGFDEWLFAEVADRERFLEMIPNISWGERYQE